MRWLFDPERLGFLGAALVLAIAVVFYGGDSADPMPPPRAADASPRRPPPELPRDAPRRPLPPPSPSDPVFRVEVGAKGDSSGTAFAIGDGWWMTARHVVDSCDRYGVVRAPRAWERGTDRAVHRGADLAVFRTSRQGPRLELADRGLAVDESAYMIGYPQGKRGAVIARLLGRSRMASRGRYSADEPVIAWAEIERVPEFDGPLGGLSGGPALSDDGRLIGVAVAASRRRGRVFTSAPATIAGVWSHVPGRRDAGPTSRVPVAASALPEVARRLLDSLTVARVVCFVD